jgi:4-hydroxy-2-oxoheptanedioate aldolase
VSTRLVSRYIEVWVGPVSFKERLQSGDVLQGVLTVIPSAVVTQAIAAAGADFVTIDREHGPIGREALHSMIAATAGTSCAPLVRVPSIDEAEVKLALDMGAEGVLFPLVRTAADAERCVALVTYPPKGLRGFGPFIAHSRQQTSLGEYLDEIGPQISCGLLLETVEAVEHIEEILDVPGVDYVVAAQFDLSTALGYRAASMHRISSRPCTPSNRRCWPGVSRWGAHRSRRR